VTASHVNPALTTCRRRDARGCTQVKSVTASQMHAQREELTGCRKHPSIVLPDRHMRLNCRGLLHPPIAEAERR
jgi:hypothetical protein